jgi:hypothetical protein
MLLMEHSVHLTVPYELRFNNLFAIRSPGMAEENQVSLRKVGLKSRLLRLTQSRWKLNICSRPYRTLSCTLNCSFFNLYYFFVLIKSDPLRRQFEKVIWTLLFYMVLCRQGVTDWITCPTNRKGGSPYGSQRIRDYEKITVLFFKRNKKFW